MIAWMMTLAGCAAEDTDSGCFWCTDTVWETQVDSGSNDSKDSKDSKDSETSGAKWLAAIQTDFSAGSIDYAFTDEGGAGSCQLLVTLKSLASVDPCDGCSFSATMTVSAVSVTSDAGACDVISDPIATEGSTLVFGQSTASLGEYQGIEYFKLMQEQEGAWAGTDGYSFVYQDGGAEIWSFGVK